ncbi:MAG: metal-dependent transcriptional regulator [Clostridia bacterium]|nr:metal-dependent transcriptional regulator [Clostridia bacterium]
MHLQESGEMYLETVYILTQKSDSVRSIDICEYMGYSKPSVSRAIGLLKNGGYITVDGKGYITLTEEGRAIALKMFERHTMLTNFLVGLGVDEKTASEDACKIEHHISEESFNAIKNHTLKFGNQ